MIICTLSSLNKNNERSGQLTVSLITICSHEAQKLAADDEREMYM